MKFFLYDTSQTLMPNVKATAISATVDQELGKYDALNATFAKTTSNVEDFKKVDKVGVEVDGQLELFKITQPEISDNQITIAGVESASDDLAHQSYMLASSNDSLSLSQALSMVFAGTTWNYDLQADDTTAGIDFSTGTKQEALEQVLDTWQVECYFTYSATTSKITNQVCHIVNKRGIETHKRLVKGVNVSSFTYSRDLSTIVTGAYATGATPDNENADTSSTDESNTTNQDDTEKQPYNLADSSWSTANGDPMDHDLGNPTLVLQGATNQYGYVDSNGNRLPRMVTLSYSNDDPQQLIRHVYDYLLIHSQPSLTLTATVYKLQSASLGNRYIAIDRADGIVDASIRAIKIQRNLLNDQLSVVTLGNYTIPTASERAKKQQKQTQKAEKTAKEAKEKADKADKETKEAKEKADKATKDLDDYKDSETKRRAAKAKEHAANHEARVKADADRDAKIAQNSKDISDIKNSGAGGTTNFDKMTGRVTFEMEKDSKTKVKTVNINNSDNTQFVIDGEGIKWKSPDKVKADAKKTQDEIDEENKALSPLVDTAGDLMPPLIQMTSLNNDTAKFGNIDFGTFGLTVGTKLKNDEQDAFQVTSNGEHLTMTGKVGDTVADLDTEGLSISDGKFAVINGEDGLTVAPDQSDEFKLKLTAGGTKTDIDKKGIRLVRSESLVEKDPHSSSGSNYTILDGMDDVGNTELDDHVLTYGEIKKAIDTAFINWRNNGTIYSNMKTENWQYDRRYVTFGDFYYDKANDDATGVVMREVLDAMESKIEVATQTAVTNTLEYLHIDPEQYAKKHGIDWDGSHGIVNH